MTIPIIKKQFHSIVLQGVAAARERFIHVSIGYAGSIHDARVLHMSSLVKEVEDERILLSLIILTGGSEEKRPLWISDPAYKPTNWCMKPYPETRAITQNNEISTKHQVGQGW